MITRTYDIINAGPRNRFMVNGRIVSNSGRGPQPHNLPRGDDIITALQDDVFDLYPSRCPELLDTIMGDPLNVVSSCLRGMLTAAPGHDLIAADFSAIEGRGLAWLAGEQWVLDSYIAGKDPYKVAASGIYKIPYEQVDGGGKGRQRQVGKTAELACGYQGGWKAMLAFGADRLGMTEQEMKDVVTDWRNSRPETVRLWKALEEAAFRCVAEKVNTRYRTTLFRMHGKFLHMVLPSGRPLWYYAPRIQKVVTPWGEEKPMVTAMSVDSLTKQWVRRSYHGGLWTENITQAMCRDLLARALLRCEAAGYPVVMHVHDEIVAEVPEGFGSVKEMEAVMSDVPTWAQGMPINAAGFRGKRYKKD